MTHPAEVTQTHTRLLKCTLEVENSRAYWQQIPADGSKVPARQAFEEFWFGSRSLERTAILLTNFRARFDAYPFALEVLRQWRHMGPDTRRLLCHWHLQLSDPLYRAFTGLWLVERWQRPHPKVTHHLAVKWVEEVAPGRWGMATRLQFGSKLLTSAYAAGLVTRNQDPRPLRRPRVGDAALVYLMYLLRGVRFAGTLLDNPYVTSVGLVGGVLEERLRSLPGLHFRRQGDLVDFDWSYPDLGAWAEVHLGSTAGTAVGGSP